MSDTPPAIDLLVSDVDGTLVTHDKLLTPGTLAAVRRLADAGIGFTITSSRPPVGLVRLIEQLDIRLPVGAFNGGAIVDRDGTAVRTHLLSPTNARHAVTTILDHGLDAWVYDSEQWFVRDPEAPHVARETYTLGVPPVPVQEFGRSLDQAGKIVAVGDDPNRLENCRTELDRTLDGCVSATRSQKFFLDVTHAAANKGTVVDVISEISGIPAHRIATIGDGWNDVMMFRRSGYSIAMGNGDESVQREADIITASNEEDGFAKAVDLLLAAREKER